MSDNNELDKFMESLDITPDENAKQKAKEAFLKKAEEVKKMNESEKEEKSKKGFRFWKSKQSILSFVSGMAAMLVLMAGVVTAVNPTFLAGTMTGSSKVIRYRMFDTKTIIPDTIVPEKYISELSILHTPKNNQIISDAYTLCDGKKLSIFKYSVLFSALSGGYDSDYTKYEFGVPNYSNKQISGFSYFIVQSGYFPAPGSKSSEVKDDIKYVADDIYKDINSYNNNISAGEIVLLKTVPSI
jgi:hypothetical protein